MNFKYDFKDLYEFYDTLYRYLKIFLKTYLKLIF